MARTLSFLLLFAFGKTHAQQTVGLFLNDPVAVDGYVLFSNSQTAYLIDNCGRVVNQWESGYNTTTSQYLLPNGDLLRTCRIGGSFAGGGAAGRIERYNWDGELTWHLDYASTAFHHHHDIAPLPNGNILLLAWEYRSPVEAIDWGRSPSLISPQGLWPETIVEVQPSGTNGAEVVWEWHLWDHVVQDMNSQLPNFGVISQHPELVNLNFAEGQQADWIHANAIAYNAALDQIALSSRVFSEIWIIDHSTTTAQAASHSGGNAGKGGDLLYRWGNPVTYNMGGPGDQQLYGQHHVHWVEEGHPHAGKLMVFNNGENRFPTGDDFSSVDIWKPPMDGQGGYFIENGQPFGPANLDWTYEADDFFSTNVSGAHALPGGNVFICEGRDGRFFEINENGDLLWEYINPVSGGGPVAQGEDANNNSTFRAERYPASFPGFVGKDLTPGEPVELDPLPSNCVISSIAGEPDRLDIWLRQNPFSHSLNLENASGRPIGIEIFDGVGRLVFTAIFAEQTLVVETGDWPAGLYVLRAAGTGGPVFSQKLIKVW